MRAIQDRALDLFDDRGFEAVTIEEIAAAAEVSPSSVYRYFGTKEGILVADEFDSMSQEAVEDLLDVTDPVGSLLQAVRRYEETPGQTSQDAPGPDTTRSPWRRVRYFFQEPSVRMAACAALDRAAQRIAPVMAAGGGMTETQARVAAHALVFGYFAALEQWHLDGSSHPIAQYVEEGMQPLRRIWSTPGEPAGGPDKGRRQSRGTKTVPGHPVAPSRPDRPRPRSGSAGNP
jgi:AcrR family transcriptional regulator